MECSFNKIIHSITEVLLLKDSGHYNLKITKNDHNNELQLVKVELLTRNERITLKIITVERVTLTQKDILVDC